MDSVRTSMGTLQAVGLVDGEEAARAWTASILRSRWARPCRELGW